MHLFFRLNINKHGYVLHFGYVSFTTSNSEFTMWSQLFIFRLDQLFLIVGFTVDGATLWAGCLFHSKTILQVTHGEVILIDGDNIQVWKSSKWITLVAVNEITGMILLLISDLSL